MKEKQVYESNTNEKNYDDCISIIREENNKMYSASTNIDVKCGLYMSFLLIFLGFVFNIDTYKVIFCTEFVTKHGLLLYSLSLILNITYVISSVCAIFSYLDILKNLSVPTFGDDFFVENKDLKRTVFQEKLLKKYISFINSTHSVLTKKSAKFNSTLNYTKFSLLFGLISIVYNTICT